MPIRSRKQEESDMPRLSQVPKGNLWDNRKSGPGVPAALEGGAVSLLKRVGNPTHLNVGHLSMRTSIKNTNSVKRHQADDKFISHYETHDVLGLREIMKSIFNLCFRDFQIIGELTPRPHLIIKAGLLATDSKKQCTGPMSPTPWNEDEALVFLPCLGVIDCQGDLAPAL